MFHMKRRSTNMLTIIIIIMIIIIIIIIIIMIIMMIIIIINIIIIGCVQRRWPRRWTALTAVTLCRPSPVSSVPTGRTALAGEGHLSCLWEGGRGEGGRERVGDSARGWGASLLSLASLLRQREMGGGGGRERERESGGQRSWVRGISLVFGFFVTSGGGGREREWGTALAGEGHLSCLWFLCNFRERRGEGAGGWRREREWGEWERGSWGERKRERERKREGVGVR